MNNQEIANILQAETLHVSEQFYSIQGEGSTMGAPSYFLRLSGCNLMCGGKGTEKDGKLHNGATWRCDSIDVWRKGKQKSFAKICKEFGEGFWENLKQGSHIVITGGEPMLHQQQVRKFLSYLCAELDGGYPIVEIETNGTIMPDNGLLYWVSHWNVSPKLANSGEPHSKRVNLPVLESILGFSNLGRRPGILKFVVSEHHDIVEILKDFVNPLREKISLKSSQVYLMPAASDERQLSAVSKEVAEFCKDFCFNYSHRLQLSIWDQTTGV